MEKTDPALNVALPEYHQSEILLFLKCGLQHYFRYILGIKVPPKAALTVGSSVDAGVNHNFSQKISSGQDEPLAAIVEECASAFEARSPETEWGNDDKGQQKDMAIQLVTAHYRDIAPKVRPETVQESFLIETPEYRLGGIMDLTESDTTVVDTKTSKNSYKDEQIYHAIQPSLYTFAYETIRRKRPRAFRFDVLIKPTKTLPARTQQMQAEITTEDHEWLFTTVDRMHRALKAGVALPAAEGSWWCSKDWCGYWHMCKGKRK